MKNKTKMNFAKSNGKAKKGTIIIENEQKMMKYNIGNMLRTYLYV
jgi:hypothetical protein